MARGIVALLRFKGTADRFYRDVDWDLLLFFAFLFIVIDVIDNGVGISEKDLPHIFERFYRGEPRTSSGKLLDPRGLGQGLFVARMVTESHGGFVRVRSQKGQGSAFTIVLPVAQQQ